MMFRMPVDSGETEQWAAGWQWNPASSPDLRRISLLDSYIKQSVCKKEAQTKRRLES